MRFQVIAYPWWADDDSADVAVSPRVLASCDSQRDADLRAYVVSKERVGGNVEWGFVGVREIER